MKPKTKFQKLIVSVNNRIPDLTEAQKKWAFVECLEHMALRTLKGKITCLDCAHTWESHTEQAWQDEVMGYNCPNCKTSLKIKTTRKRVFDNGAWFTILTKAKGFQVIRTFEIRCIYKSGKLPMYYIIEFSRLFINSKGEHAIVGRIFNYYTGNYSGVLELRNNNAITNHIINPYKYYPRISIIPEIERNGFKGNLNGMHPFDLFTMILKEPKAETLLKTNQISLLKACTEGRRFKKIQEYWASVKICIRNNYIVSDATTWLDQLELLEYYNKDLHSPKYVCPLKLKKEHSKYSERKRKDLAKKKYLELKAKIDKEQKVYLKEKQKFFDLEFTEDEISIQVIKSVKEVMELGDYFRHCIFVNKYYKKQNSLLLCAKVDNVPVETIEISLTRFEVVQSYGHLNNQTEHSQKINELINKNMTLIKKATLPQKRRRQTKKVAA